MAVYPWGDRITIVSLAHFSLKYDPRPSILDSGIPIPNLRSYISNKPPLSRYDNSRRPVHVSQSLNTKAFRSNSSKRTSLNYGFRLPSCCALSAASNKILRHKIYLAGDQTGDTLYIGAVKRGQKVCMREITSSICKRFYGNLKCLCFP